MKEPSKQVLRLVKKIKKDTGIECDPYTFRRTYAGYWQKSSGAFVWIICANDVTSLFIGSADTMTECIRKNRKLEFDCEHNEIFAVKERKTNGKKK